MLHEEEIDIYAFFDFKDVFGKMYWN